MRNRFDRQLEQLNDELTKMGSMIERAIGDAVTALVTRDRQKAEEIIRFDAKIDRQEKEIESLCMKLLLQQQPVARDLRLISSALKMITDMERIGDQAADIAELAALMENQGGSIDLGHIGRMGRETTAMVIDSVDAFVEKDPEKARQVLAHDDIVDELFTTVRSEVIELIHSDMDRGEQAADVLMTAKYFERIGDHATNIAEWVIYSITGEHGGEEPQKTDFT